MPLMHMLLVNKLHCIHILPSTDIQCITMLHYDIYIKEIDQDRCRLENFYPCWWMGGSLLENNSSMQGPPNPMWCSRESGLCGLEGGMEGGRVPALVPLPVTSLGDSTKPLTSSGKVTNDTMYTVIYKNE